MTKIERLSLANQFKILALLDPEQSDGYLNNVKILQEGYSSYYPSILQEVEEDLSLGQCSYVIDVLAMHYDLLTSFENLPLKPADLKARVRFRGFDGNEECGLLSFATHILDIEQRFGKLSRPGGYNSHSRTDYIYPEQVKRWKTIRGATGALTEIQIRDIVG